MKIYKTYFSKDDTPFNQLYQPKRKYHTIWKHYAYKSFLGHKVIKVKKFGIFKVNGVSSPTSMIDKMFEKVGTEE